MTGELLALGAAFSFGLAGAAIAKGAIKSSGESGVLLSAIATGLVAGMAWLMSGGLDGEERTSWTAIAWFVASGLLATVGGRITMFKSIEFAGVVRASTTRRLIPFLSLFLSWLFMGESVSALAGGGMVLIALSFAILFWDNRSRIRILTDDPQRRAMISRGLAFGVISALLYANSLIARQFGLIDKPDAFFGALIGAVTAIFYYACAASVSAKYRLIVRAALTAPDPWQLLAALLISLGQLAQFGALMFTGAGMVAFLNSFEIYISAFLAVFVLRTEPMPGRAVIGATALATTGVMLMAIRF